MDASLVVPMLFALVVALEAETQESCKMSKVSQTAHGSVSQTWTSWSLQLNFNTMKYFLPQHVIKI